jgi:hypothetical protein
MADLTKCTRNYPEFYIVGAAKSGTTALWSWLRQHKDVCLPDIKEPGFFSFAGTDAAPRAGHFDANYVALITVTAAGYKKLYAGAGAGDQLRGDVSPVCLPERAALARLTGLDLRCWGPAASATPPLRRTGSRRAGLRHTRYHLKNRAVNRDPSSGGQFQGAAVVKPLRIAFLCLTVSHGPQSGNASGSIYLSWNGVRQWQANVPFGWRPVVRLRGHSLFHDRSDAAGRLVWALAGESPEPFGELELRFLAGEIWQRHGTLVG